MAARAGSNRSAVARYAMTPSHDVIKHSGDAFSLAIVGSTLLEILPAIAAMVSIVWGCLRVYQTILQIQHIKQNRAAK
jgi:hypothetical protein